MIRQLLTSRTIIPVLTICSLLAAASVTSWAQSSTTTGRTATTSVDSTSTFRVDVVYGALTSSADVDGRAVSPSFRYSMPCGYYRLHGAAGFVHTVVDRPGNESRQLFGLTNAIIGISRPLELPQISTTFNIGLSAGIPLAFYMMDDVEDKRVYDFGLTTSMAAQGFTMPYQWMVNTAPIFANVETFTEFADGFGLSLDVAPAVLLPLNDRPVAASVAWNISADVRSGRYAVDLGVSTFVSTTALENGDHSQSAVVTHHSYDLGAVGIDLLVALNLDGPHGLFFENTSVRTGARIGLSYTFGDKP